MKKGMIALVVACVLLVSTGATSFASDAPPIFNPPQHYYLALGDSLAFGYQAATFNQNFPVEPPTAFSSGYVDDFTSMLQDVRPQLQAINFGCTGETTVTFIQGGCIYTAQGFQLHNGYAGSQLSAAVAFLGQHPGQVSPITLNLGGNDLNALAAQCGSDVSCYQQQAPIVLAQIASHLNQILDALRKAAPGSEIITMTSYSTSFLLDPRFLQLADGFNTVITTTERHKERVSPMKKGFVQLYLVIGLLAALLVSCGPSATGHQTGGTPTASSHAHVGRIAWQGFLNHDETTAAIFSANADGTDARQLTHPHNGDSDEHPAWSPDGSKIIFTLNSPNTTGDIFLMNADGTGQRQLTHCTQVCLGMDVSAWSPDGSTIAYSEGEGPSRPNGDPEVGALWLMHADGSHPVQLTHPPLPTSYNDDEPAWSPDGTRLVFARNHLRGQSYEDQALFVINRDGTGLKQVTALGQLEAGNAHWSPDGTRILFQSFASFAADTTPQLYTIFPDGTHLVQLTTNERNTWPAWSPDGTKIIFVHRSSTGVDQNAHLYEMNADGSGLIQITKNDFRQNHPAWGTAP